MSMEIDRDYYISFYILQLDAIEDIKDRCLTRKAYIRNSHRTYDPFHARHRRGGGIRPAS